MKNMLSNIMMSNLEDGNHIYTILRYKYKAKYFSSFVSCRIQMTNETFTEYIAIF